MHFDIRCFVASFKGTALYTLKTAALTSVALRPPLKALSCTL